MNNNKTNEFQSGVSSEEKTWGMLVHLSAFLQFIVFVPFGLVVGPLLVWLIKKDSMPFVKKQGREVLNFNLSIVLYVIVLAVWFALLSMGVVCLTYAIPTFFSSIFGGIYSFLYGFLLIFSFLFLFLFWLVNTIRGAITANKGISFEYPLTIHFLSDKK